MNYGPNSVDFGTGIGGVQVANQVREPNLIERVHNLEQRADSGVKMTQELGQLTEQRLRRIEQVLGL